MAHFAKISEDNTVLSVHAVHDGNAASEAKGAAFLERVHGWPEHLWIQTSYNTLMNKHYTEGVESEDQSKAFRGNYAGIGFSWDSENQIFWTPKPYASHTKDVANAKWQAPHEHPALTAEQEAQNEAATHFWTYRWDEAAYQADNTAGWILTNLDA
tara:strand:+ start:26 stop:493 length:468 start_codon:yes stop_codon:yes gene_type:complete